MGIVPSPEEARDLRAAYADHPIIALALAWLAAAGVDHVRDALLELPRWEHFAQLSEREIAATLAAFVPPPADVCTRCGRGVRYVTDGPDVEHVTDADVAVLLTDDSQRPHPPTPDFGGER
ncbi:hypothetical protein ACQEVZ_38605 [Dactylosporangium sp. CA-152071]|uniref:hypothetical protein n=1 Tax=Dactylosporangium sp. CA-152071 TaxID=3239933 RepID=UPI003D90A101